MACQHADPEIVKFDVGPDDARLILQIVGRYASFYEATIGKLDRLCCMMDLTACHANGNPLRLADMVATEDEFSFVHDVGGIMRHIDRDTGKLLNCFRPRFSQPEPLAA